MLCSWADCQTKLTTSDEEELLNAHHYFRGRVNPLATNMERMVRTQIKFVQEELAVQLMEKPK